jgi:DNA polymerase-1
LNAGIGQALSKDWEADDVIGTLVRDNARCGTEDAVILSTDRDYLQLVNENVFLLIPPPRSKVSAVSETKLYGVDDLRREWGVGPEEILAFRALDGDDSDELPGVKNVRRKFLSKVVGYVGGDLEKLYSCVRTGAFGSTKFTKAQTASLLSHEVQAKLNLELMTLQDVAMEWIGNGTEVQYAFAEMLDDVSIQREPMMTMLFGEKTVDVPRQGSLFA